MSIVDQAEIDALLAEASDLVAEANTAAQDPPPPPPPPPRPHPLPNDPALARVLRVRVPVIVQLAQRIMPIATVRNLSVGSIIEFEKSVEHPLELLINNRPIGQGTCVKVGENFGLRITSIVDKAQRIRSLV